MTPELGLLIGIGLGMIFGPPLVAWWDDRQYRKWLENWRDGT